MFFVLPEPSEANEDQQWDIYARIRLDGEVSLVLKVLLPKDLALNLASDFLGSDPDEVTDEALFDLMKELANMIGGNTVTEMKSSTEMSLGIPESGFMETTEISPAEQDNMIVIQIHDQRMAVVWSEE